MLSLVRQYHPITGDPFHRDETYWEMPPCAALKPYIRCFWGTLHPIAPDPDRQPPPTPGLVIPDTCMDIIFDIDYTGNRFSAAFCTLDEHSYRTGSGGNAQPSTIATFAIRFYAWTAYLFADWDFTGKKNAAFDPREMFRPLTEALKPHLFDEPTLAGKAAIAEKLLLSYLPAAPDPDLMNAVHRLLTADGRARIADLADYAAVSPRKLERLFQYHMGVSPKSFASLVRYQLLWQELAQGSRCSALDLVEKYGYSDQAHLLHDFKRRHLMTPAEALRFAGVRP